MDGELRPRRTHLSNVVFSLPGGNEDNDLWLHMEAELGGPTLLRSTWVPTDEQRARIAAGENIELIVWGPGHPPVAMALCTYPLGAPPDADAPPG